MCSLFTECVRKQTAGEGAPGQLRIVEPLQVAGCRNQRLAPFRRLQVGRKLGDSRIVERRLPVEIAARGENEERAPQGRVSLLLCQWDLLPCDVRGDDEVDVSRSGTPLRSSPV